MDEWRRKACALATQTSRMLPGAEYNDSERGNTTQFPRSGSSLPETRYFTQRLRVRWRRTTAAHYASHLTPGIIGFVVTSWTDGLDMAIRVVIAEDQRIVREVLAARLAREA